MDRQEAEDLVGSKDVQGITAVGDCFWDAVDGRVLMNAGVGVKDKK